MVRGLDALKRTTARLSAGRIRQGLLCILLLGLSACGGPTPPPTPIVVTVGPVDGGEGSPPIGMKPLERRGWVEVRVDAKDRRGRRLHLTDAGRAVLARAVAIWVREHAAVEAGLPDAGALRQGLNALAFGA